ncbi:MAG: RNA-guided endonuclease InsQ/TnpB family protein [Candidatus Hermodarchaeota archaeon]
MLTRKFRIEPTHAQDQVLWALSQVCRRLYNQALEERRFVYQQYGVTISYVDQQNALPHFKVQFPQYKQVYSKVLQMTLKKLDAAYKAYFGLVQAGDPTARPPQFRGRKYFFTLCYNQSGFKLTPTTIQLAHKHSSKVSLTFAVPFDLTSHRVKQIELFHHRSEQQFYLAVTYEVVAPAYQDNGLYQAFDLGVTKHTAVNLAGKFLESTVKRPDKYWAPQVRTLQQRRDRCKPGSRRWRQFHQRLLTIQRKCRNQTLDWQHKQSLHLVTNTKANTLIVGDLSVKPMVQTLPPSTPRTPQVKGLNRAVHNTGHLGRFVELLTYKAQKLGKKVIVIDERHTSKTCCVCGQQQAMPLHQRHYHCECGNQLDRDQNAAVNILCRFLSQHALWTSYQQFLTNCQTSGNLRHFFTAKRQTKVSSLGGWADSQEVGPFRDQ